VLQWPKTTAEPRQYLVVGILQIKHRLNHSYSTNEFYEGYINLADFITGGVTFCPSTYMLETRASQSITAVLDDFVGGPLAGAPIL
jgi:hypothetical protein